MQLGSDDRRDRLPHDLARGPAEHRFGRAVERADPAVGKDREDSFGRVLDHRAVVRFAALRVVSRRGGLPRLLGELTPRPASLYSTIAPAIRIAIANTKAPRPPIVCASDPLKNDGAQPASTSI